VAVTLFWDRLLKSRRKARKAQDLSPFWFSPQRVCQLHQRSACKYGVDCSGVHLCRELWASLQQLMRLMDDEKITGTPSDTPPSPPSFSPEPSETPPPSPVVLHVHQPYLLVSPTPNTERTTHQPWAQPSERPPSVEPERSLTRPAYGGTSQNSTAPSYVAGMAETARWSPACSTHVPTAIPNGNGPLIHKGNAAPKAFAPSPPNTYRTHVSLLQTNESIGTLAVHVAGPEFAAGYPAFPKALPASTVPPAYLFSPHPPPTRGMDGEKHLYAHIRPPPSLLAPKPANAKISHVPKHLTVPSVMVLDSTQLSSSFGHLPVLGVV